MQPPESGLSAVLATFRRLHFNHFWALWPFQEAAFLLFLAVLATFGEVALLLLLAVWATFRRLHSYLFRPFWPLSGCMFINFGRFGHF